MDEVVFITILTNMLQTLQIANETIKQQQLAINVLLALISKE